MTSKKPVKPKAVKVWGMTPLENLNSEYRSGKGRHVRVNAKDLALALNLIDAARVVENTFKDAGVSGIIADWGPVSDAIKSLTTPGAASDK